MKSHPRVGLLVLVTAVMLPVHGVSQTLNPLVTRNLQASATVPAYCNESLAPAQTPRVDVAEIPEPVIEIEPASIPAPPSGSLRASLQNAQAALARNDRPEFDRALADARELLATYPTGAERRTGEELVRIYGAAARLWDAQYQSPFFAEGSPEYASVSGYPGYADAVRRSTITVNEQRLYPAAESRDFLARVAAERLRGIGIRQAPTRVTRADAPRRAPTASSSSSSSRSTAAAPRSASASASPRRMPRPPRSSAPARPRLSSPATSSPSPSAAATSTPGPPNPPASPATAAAAAPAAPMTGSADQAPAAASPATESPTEDVPATASTASTETVAPTAASVEAPPSPPAPAATAPSRTRSVVLPTILILIGLGVLIVLFRASK